MLCVNGQGFVWKQHQGLKAHQGLKGEPYQNPPGEQKPWKRDSEVGQCGAPEYSTPLGNRSG